MKNNNKDILHARRINADMISIVDQYQKQYNKRKPKTKL